MNNIEFSLRLEHAFRACYPSFSLCRDDFDLTPTKTIESGLYYLRDCNAITDEELKEELTHYFFGDGNLSDVMADPDCLKELDRLFGKLAFWSERLQQLPE